MRSHYHNEQIFTQVRYCKSLREEIFRMDNTNFIFIRAFSKLRTPRTVDEDAEISGNEDSDREGPGTDVDSQARQKSLSLFICYSPK